MTPSRPQLPQITAVVAVAVATLSCQVLSRAPSATQPPAPDAATPAGDQISQNGDLGISAPYAATDLPTRFVPCIEQVGVGTQADGSLKVIFATDCAEQFPFSPTRLWMWTEAYGEVVPYPLPEDAIGPQASADGHLLAFRRASGDALHELWVMDSDGGHSRMLAEIPLPDLGDLAQRYPEVETLHVGHGWVGDAYAVFYEVRPMSLERNPLESLVVIDAATGAELLRLEPGKFMIREFSPDGNQVAALEVNQLTLIEVRSGTARTAIPLDWQFGADTPLAYSTDGRRVAVFTNAGLAIIDTVNSDMREAPFAYLLWGAGDTPLYAPRLHWTQPGALVALVAPPFELGDQPLELFEELLDWEFGVYTIDLTDMDLAVGPTFRGNYRSAMLSPDLRHLAYVREARDSLIRELRVVELVSGTETLYATGEQLRLVGWSPGSNRFLYSVEEQEEIKAELGELEMLPIRLGVRPYSVIWVDNERFLANPAHDGLALHLYRLGGEEIPIATVAAGPSSVPSSGPTGHAGRTTFTVGHIPH